MTFLQLQDAVMARLSLTSSDARTRIKGFINQRLRDVQSSVNTAKTRRTTASIATTSGAATTTVSGLAEILTLFDPTTSKEPLGEWSLDQIRQTDPNHDHVGVPRIYAEQARNADAITLRWYPKPDAVYTFTADVLTAGTDLSADGDIPTLPVDYHDILIAGAVADEYYRMEKGRPLALTFEQKYEKRLSELRYFLAKSAYLRLRQTDAAVPRPRGWHYEGWL